MEAGSQREGGKKNRQILEKNLETNFPWPPMQKEQPFSMRENEGKKKKDRVYYLDNYCSKLSSINQAEF